jgi:glycosyltransferase involved in cell wall biosynthesis
MPKVSVIVPVYGVEKYIERCAESLFKQTLSDMEFIFVDDCTPDKSMELLGGIIEKNRLRFAEMNWMVRTERMPANSGQSAVRRHGIEVATGDFIAHCDSDDWVEEDMYKLMYEQAIANNLDMVVCDYYYNEDMKQVELLDNPPRDIFNYLQNLIVKKNIGAVWNKLCKRNLYKDDFIYPAGSMGEDQVITIQTAYNAKRVGHVARCLYHYYFNTSSITNEVNKDKILNRTKQSIANGLVIASFLERVGLNETLCKELDYLKLRKKNNYAQLFDEKKYRDLWVNTYKEINCRVFWNPYMSLRMRLNYLQSWMKVLF